MYIHKSPCGCWKSSVDDIGDLFIDLYPLWRIAWMEMSWYDETLEKGPVTFSSALFSSSDFSAWAGSMLKTEVSRNIELTVGNDDSIVLGSERHGLKLVPSGIGLERRDRWRVCQKAQKRQNWRWLQPGLYTNITNSQSRRHNTVDM